MTQKSMQIIKIVLLVLVSIIVTSGSGSREYYAVDYCVLHNLVIILTVCIFIGECFCDQISIIKQQLCNKLPSII